MILQPWFWAFNGIVVVLLVLDLFVFHRKSHVIKTKEAILMSLLWISIALLFNFYVYYIRGGEDALNFLTGYLVEKSLSVDNLFVFLLIFNYFLLPAELMHTVLFWGIFGAIVMRTIFIIFGIALIHHFHWMIYIFGAFLIYTGIKLALEKDKEIHPEANIFIKLFRKVFPITQEYHGAKFFVRKEGRTYATPLIPVLLAVETTDVVFAVDSIPAIIGITKDPFIVYTSNILAILGLRALFFALAHVLKLFHYLHYGLAFILVFIGFKMLFADIVKIPIVLSLAIVAAALLVTAVASILYKNGQVKMNRMEAREDGQDEKQDR